MEQYQENAFLDNEANYLKQYDEEDAALVSQALNGPAHEGAENTSDVKDGTGNENQVFESFMKEKHIVLNYVYDLILYAARLHEIKLEDIFLTEMHRKRADFLVSKIKCEQDAVNIKNRVSVLIMKYLE
jgi:hypothetical protein